METLKEFDWALYYKSLKWVNVLKFISVLSLLYFADYLFDLICFIVDQWMYRFPQGFVSQVILLFFLGYTIFIKIKDLKKNLWPTLESLIYFLTLNILYFIWSRATYKFQFYPIFDFTSKIFYGDVFFLIFSMHLLHFKSFNKSISRRLSSSALKYDSPLDDDHIDFLENGSFARRLSSLIETSKGKSSFSIGITGSWGSGKTDLLARTVNILSKSDENIIVEFNPWRSSIFGKKTIVKGFFSTLGKELNKYNKDSSKKFQEYFKSILSADKNIPEKLIDKIFQEYSSESAITKVFDELNSIINSTGKRLIIAIDDLDRMSAEEIVSVFTLIRNVAHFNNTFFLIPFDHQYVVKAIRKSKLFPNPEEYLNKIFQLSVAIPKIRKDNFGVYLQDLMDKSGLFQQDDLNLVAGTIKSLSSQISWEHFMKEDHHVESLLQNYRDVNRFYNSFILSYSILKEEVNVEDLFMLELIKLNSYTLYNLLASKQVLNTHQRSYAFDENRWRLTVPLLKTTEFKIVALEKAVRDLFSLQTHDLERRIYQPENFFLYFSYFLFNQISMKEYRTVSKEDSESMAKFYTRVISEDKIQELNQILDLEVNFSSRALFEKFVYAQLLVLNQESFLSRAIKLITKFELINRMFNNNLTDYQDYLFQLLEDQKITLKARILLSGEIIIRHLKKKLEEFQIELPKLKQIIVRLFRMYLDHQTGFNYEMLNLYAKNIEEITPGNTIIIEESRKNLKEYLMHDFANLDDFIKYLIINYESPITDETKFAFRAYTSAVFENLQDFKSMLSNHQMRESRYQFLPELVKKNLNNETFNIEGNERVIMIELIENIYKNGKA